MPEAERTGDLWGSRAGQEDTEDGGAAGETTLILSC